MQTNQEANTLFGVLSRHTYVTYVDDRRTTTSCVFSISDFLFLFQHFNIYVYNSLLSMMRLVHLGTTMPLHTKSIIIHLKRNNDCNKSYYWGIRVAISSTRPQYLFRLRHIGSYFWKLGKTQLKKSKENAIKRSMDMARKSQVKIIF